MPIFNAGWLLLHLPTCFASALHFSYGGIGVRYDNLHDTGGWWNLEPRCLLRVGLVKFIGISRLAQRNLEEVRLKRLYGGISHCPLVRLTTFLI